MEPTSDPRTRQVEREIAGLQQQVNQALIAADEQTLQRLVAADCQIVGPKGYMITTEQWIRVRRGGDDYQQLVLRPVRENVCIYDRAAIRCDVVESACTF